MPIAMWDNSCTVSKVVVPLVETAEWIEHLCDSFDFAERAWQAEKQIYGPRTVKLRKPHASNSTALDFSNLPPLLTLAQTASVIGKTVPAVKAMLYRNELPATRVGKRGRRIIRGELSKQYGIGVKRGKK